MSLPVSVLLLNHRSSLSHQFIPDAEKGEDVPKGFGKEPDAKDIFQDNLYIKCVYYVMPIIHAPLLAENSWLCLRHNGQKIRKGKFKKNREKILGNIRGIISGRDF